MLSFQPDPTEFATLAKEHAIVPVWCEVVADTLTPVAAFANMVGQDDGFLFESVEGGERWGRYSFVGRRPLATLTARGTSVDAAGRLGVDSSDQGILSAIEDLLSRFHSPTLDGLPPLHGGLVGYLGYDVVREIERLPAVPPDDLGHPDAALVVIGQFAAFDHWRQRIVLIDNVVVPESADRATLARAYEDACGRLRQLAVDCARTEAGEMMPAPLPGIAAAEATRTVSSEEYRAGHRVGQGVHPGRRHLPGGALPALRPAAGGRPLRRLPLAAAAQPQPVSVFPALPRGDRGRGLARADGAPA